MPPEAGDAAPETTRLPQLLLVLILALSAFVQLGVVSKSEVDNPLRADAGEYFSYAYNLKHYGVYSSAPTWAEAATAAKPQPDQLRTPGYPLFLAALGSPEPTESFLRRVEFTQAGLGVLTVWLAYLVAVSFLGRPAALAAALLTAISPHLATMSSYLLSETLFTFLLLASALALIRAAASGKAWLFALAGSLWGACALVRPTAQYFIVLLFLLVLAVPLLRRHLRQAFLVLGCFVAIQLPWGLRNLSVPDPAPSLMVSSLAHGAYPGFKFEGRPETFGFPYRFDPEYERHVESLSTVLKHISGRFAAEPATYSRWYLFGKPYFFLSLEDAQSVDVTIYPTLHTPYYEDLRFALMRIASIEMHWPLMLLGLLSLPLLGLFGGRLGLSASQLQAARIAGLLFAYAIMLHMVVAPFPRYAIPFRPLIFGLAFIPLQALLWTWKSRRARA